MTAAIILIVLALLIGGFGLAVEAVRWMLIIAMVLLVVGLFTGYRGRGPRY